MNFFLRHRKSLAREGIVPLTILLLFAIGSAYFHPAGVSWQLFLGKFFDSPLSMGLELVVTIVLLGYILHHIISPQAPHYRGYFVAAALALGLVVNGMYNQRLSHTVDFMSSSGLSEFFGCAAVFYCLYRFVLLAPDHERKGAMYFFALLLSFHLIYGGIDVYKKLSAGIPCSSAATPDLWSAIVYENPSQHCAP